MPQFHRITVGPSFVRGYDPQGEGTFNKPRTHGHHHGLDILSKPGHHILAPIDGNLDRNAIAHDSGADRALGGIHIVGTGEWAGYEVWMFYVHPIVHGQIKAGQPIGIAQNLAAYPKYKGIMNHVHVQVKKDGQFVNPMYLFGWFLQRAKTPPGAVRS